MEQESSNSPRIMLGYKESPHTSSVSFHLNVSTHKDMGAIFHNVVLDVFLLWGFTDFLCSLTHSLGVVQAISCPLVSSELVSKVASNLLGKAHPPEIANLAGNLGKVP